MDEDPTLPSPLPRRSDVSIETRYRIGEVIGKGGMGEVRLAKDLTIDRDVAIKSMHDARDKHLVARFLREARVQGQLEHPAVVPVHDLGIDATGHPYFVMKRLAGTTLFEVLANRATPQRTLLARLVDICLAIDFAHARGVVHRDLKPSNIMLGNYGEAYVLDWGLARIVDDAAPVHADSTSTDGQTQPGAMLGTPGYMAPEQVSGDRADTDSDVFALGCILFEILAGSPALPRGKAALDATLAAEAHRPSVRFPDTPPELDDLCARATARDRTLRPTARVLADALQAYLDGDRDVARRKELAAEHVLRAHEALAYADDTGRAIAMREAGRAFVLDASNRTAQDLLATLTLEAPREMPVEAVAQANRERAETRRQVFSWASVVYAITGIIQALLFVFPVRHAWPIVASVVLCGALVVVAALAGKRLLPMTSWWYTLMLALNIGLLIASAYTFGPLLIIPLFICGSLTVCLSLPGSYPNAVIIGVHVLAFAIPIGTELLGLTERTFSLDGGAVTMRPYALDLSPGAFAIVLVVSVGALLVNASLIALGQRRTQDCALDAVHTQSWHLRQLLPERADDARWERASPAPQRAHPSRGG